MPFARTNPPRPTFGLLCLAGLASLTAVSGQAATEEAADVIGVESVIQSVKQALVVAQSELDAEELPRITGVVLQLETLHSPRGDGRDELVLAKAGAPFDRGRIQKLTLDIKPPRVRSTPVAARELEEPLAQAIVAAARATAWVRMDPNPLSLSSATTQLRFVVLRAGAGGLGFAITPVSHSLDQPIGAASTQLLKITYEPR